MDAETSLKVRDLVLECSRVVDESVRYIMDAGDGSHGSMYRRLAGQIMGLMLTNILQPIYRLHPEVEPEQIKQARNAPQRTPLERTVAVQVLAALGEVGRQLEAVVELVRGSAGEAEAEAFRRSAAEVFQALSHAEKFIDIASGHGY